MSMPMPMFQPLHADEGAALPSNPMAPDAAQGSAVAIGPVAALSGSADWAESPARALHERLVETFGSPARHAVVGEADDKWPGLARLAFIFGTSAALWGVIAFVVALVF